ALVRGRTLERHPEVGSVLGLLSGALDEETMRQLNLRVEARGEAIEAVAADALARCGLVHATGTTATGKKHANLVAYMWAHRAPLGKRTLEHLALSFGGLVLGVLVAVPLGLWLERRRRVAEALVRLVGTTQTIPSLALLAFMVPFFGVGAAPAIVALWIYA